MTDDRSTDTQDRVDSHDQGAHRQPKSQQALDWQTLGSSYDEQAGLILFKKRIDKMRNPRNNRVFDRLIG